MKIIQASSYFYPHIGGVETYVIELSQSLVEMGHDVTVLCADVPKSTKFEQLNGITVCRFPALDLPYVPFICSLRKKLSKLNADVVHSHYPPPFMSKAVSATLTDVPHILTYHCDMVIPDLFATLKIPNTVKKLIEYTNKKLYLNGILDNIITIIATTNSYALTSEILNSLKIEVIPNAIPLQKFDEAANSVNCERAEHNILFVGRLTSVKGVNFLIEAAKMIIEDYPQTNLSIVGDGEDKERLVNLSKGYEDNIKFLGHVTWRNLIKLYKTSTVLALPSITRLEAFGVVLLEAMACETPVVASDIPGVRDVVDNAGLLVEPKNAKKLADGLLQVFTNPDEARLMGKRGRKLIEHNYNWTVVTEQILNLYKDAVEKTLMFDKKNQTLG